MPTASGGSGDGEGDGDGANGSQRLSPDQRIAAVGYAMVGETVRGANLYESSVSGASTSEDGAHRSVTNPAATGSRKFCRVEIVKP